MKHAAELDLGTLLWVQDFMYGKLDARRKIMATIPALIEASDDFKTTFDLVKQSAMGVGYAQACQDLSDACAKILAQVERIVTKASNH